MTGSECEGPHLTKFRHNAFGRFRSEACLHALDGRARKSNRECGLEIARQPGATHE